MPMRILLLLLIATGCFAQSKPNIIFILSDDHSQVFLGGYGHPDLKTPHLNRLASEGVRFTRAYTSAPQCVPSRAALMTGRCPVDVEMTRFSAPLGREYVTLPELLRQGGYHTGVGGRIFHLDGHTDIKENLEVFQEHNLTTFKERVDFLQNANALGKGAIDSLSIKVMQNFLQQRPKDKPFFMWLNFSNPHRPLTRFKDRPNPAKLTLPPDFPDTKLVREDLADFYGEVQDLDQSIGAVIAELEVKKLLDNTIIVFMGDNGSALFRGKGTLYERGLNVPLIVRFPKKEMAGTVCNQLISGEDIAPTLLEWASLAPDPAMTGKSFAQVRQQTLSPIHDYVFAERGAHGNGFPENSALFDLGRVVIGQRYKLIFNALWQIPYHPVDFGSQPFWVELTKENQQNQLAEPFKTLFFRPQRPVFELFDLEKDPLELNNLAGSPVYKAIEYELKVALNKWMLLNRDYLPLPLRTADSNK